VGFGEGDDEAKGVSEVSGDKFPNACKIVRVGGITNAIVIETGNQFEGECRLGFDMSFSSEADPVAKGAKVVREALGSGADSAVIPGAAVAKGIAAGVKFGTAGGAHGHAQVGVVEDE
jgi:hypothetical protein